MDTEGVFPIICGVAALVLVINGGLVWMFARSQTLDQLKIVQKTFRLARNPWADRDNDMVELRQRVEELQGDNQGATDDKNQ
jgi:hypothetical protein